MAMDLQEQYDKVYRYCLRRLRDAALAEDVTQETFTRWYASGPRREGPALRWLYTVARHLCVDEYRRQRAEPLPEDVPAPETVDRTLWQALETLTEQERELVLLRYVNQEPVSVIAGALGLSRFAVYRRTAAALEKLRRALVEEE